MKLWADKELKGSDFGDERLNRRLGKMLAALGERAGGSLPMAFQDWANTKAAYRFFANDKVSEDKIMAGHFQASAMRTKAVDGPILVLQDTTEFSFKRNAPEKIGFTKEVGGSKPKDRRPNRVTLCGLLMHASLAVTPAGLPLGLTAIKFWSRDKFKGTTALKRKVNPTRVPIEQKESIRWLENLRQSTELIGRPGDCVHIGDRESDIYELYCLAQELETNFLVRSCVDRLAEDGDTTITQVMQKVPQSGIHTIHFRDANGKKQTARLSVKFARMKVLPPIGKQKRYKHQWLHIVHAEELDPPQGRDPLFWKLITNLCVDSFHDAVEKLNWYARRWSIETWFKTLKSGCRIEQVRLTTATRLTNFIALCCIVAWRIHWMTIMNRESPEASPDTVFTDMEIEFLSHLETAANPNDSGTLNICLKKVARLGGYLNRKNDPPPGATVMWRGMARLADLLEGYNMARNGIQTCG